MKLNHIGIEVNDLYSMELFYKKVLGFKRVYHYVSRNTRGLRTVFLEREGMQIELLERPGNSDLKECKKNYHLSMEVLDVDAEYSRLNQISGLIMKAPRDTGDGFREMELSDPECNVIEISRKINPEPVYDIKGVIFDLDGTLIDSEDNYYEADRILLEEWNIPFTQEDKKRYIGGGNLDMILDLKKRFSIPASVEDMLSKKNQIYLDIALQNTPVYPEMFLFLKALYMRGLPLAIASGSSPLILDLLLEKLELKQYFPVIVSAENVKRGKPAPDVFLETAMRMGIEPQHLLVMEDSQYGVEAAKRAFMQCIAVPYLTEKPLADSFMMADLLFENGQLEFSRDKALAFIDNHGKK